MKSRVVLSVLLLASVILTGAGLAQAATSTTFPWTTMQGDLERSGFTKSSAPISNQTAWQFQAGGPIQSSPVVDAGLVFVNSKDGYLYAVNATSGTKAWAAWVGKVASSPTLADGKVFIASAGTVYAFSMATGAQVWNQTASEDTSLGAPLVFGSRLFVGGKDAIYAFNEAFGIKLFYEDVYHVSGIVRLVYLNGLVVAFALMNQSGYGLNGFEAVNTIGRFWMYLEPSGKDRYSSFLTDESAKIFAVASGTEGNSSAFGVTDIGMIMWEHQVQGSTEAFPASAYNATYVPTSKFVYALNSTDGSVQWSRPTSGAASASSPAVADGKVFFGLNDGYIYALDAFNGTQVWSYKTGGPVRSSPAISDGLLFVGSDDGYLYAIGQPTSQETSTIPEFPPWAPVPVAAAVLTGILVTRKTRFLRNNSQQRRPIK